MDRLRLLARRNRVTIAVIQEAPPEASLVEQPGGRWLLTVSAALAPDEQLSAAATLLHAVALGWRGPYHSLGFARPGAGHHLRQRLAREHAELREAYRAGLLGVIPDRMLRGWEGEAADLDATAAAAGLPAADVLERYRLDRMQRADRMHRRKPSLLMLMLLGYVQRGTDDVLAPSRVRPVPEAPPPVEPAVPSSGYRVPVREAGPPPPDDREDDVPPPLDYEALSYAEQVRAIQRAWEQRERERIAVGDLAPWEETARRRRGI